MKDSATFPSEVALAFDRLAKRPDPDRLSPLDLSRSAIRHHPLAAGVRHFLTEAEGSGYWEYFKPSDHLLVSVTDALYRQDQWIDIPGIVVFKLRLLLSGKLLDKKGDVLLTGPQALLYLSPGTSPEGYFVAGGQQTQLVVLHFRTELLQQTLGLDSGELPPPVDTMLAKRTSSASHRLGFSAEVLHAVQRILDSRHGIPSSLRSAYLESMATSILCEVLADLSNRDPRRTGPQMHGRDLNRLYEARDYLAQHFVTPPTIPELARMVGMNQTKLKAGFKAILGVTIYQYIMERRMQLASELLLTHDYNVAEIAYKVGYEYPTNFTYAFKKRFGCLPRAWSRH